MRKVELRPEQARTGPLGRSWRCIRTARKAGRQSAANRPGALKSNGGSLDPLTASCSRSCRSPDGLPGQRAARHPASRNTCCCIYWWLKVGAVAAASTHRSHMPGQVRRGRINPRSWLDIEKRRTGSIAEEKVTIPFGDAAGGYVVILPRYDRNAILQAGNPHGRSHHHRL